MSFATADLAYLYDRVWADAGQIGTNANAEEDDRTFQADVWDLIRWRKGEISYPFGEEVDDFLDVGLPITTIGNGYKIIDARDFVNDLGTYKTRSLSQVARISVHHSVTSEPTTKEAELAVLTQIGDYHVNSRGWPGYAYHTSIAGSGRPYLTGDLATTRYVVGSDNPYNIAICMLGDFTNHAPTPAALETLRLLIGELQFTLGSAIPYYGHRDTPGVEPTSCPGNSYTTWLPGLAG